MTDCPRIGKLFGGCKFTPRYDTVSATGPRNEELFALAFTGTRPPPQCPARKTYLCDVYERCGKTLFKRKATDQGDT